MKTGITKRRITDLPPWQRLQAVQRLRDLKEGRMPKPPIRCGWCRSPGLTGDPDRDGYLLCVACGKQTNEFMARKAQQTELQALILDGPLGR